MGELLFQVVMAAIEIAGELSEPRMRRRVRRWLRRRKRRTLR